MNQPFDFNYTHAIVCRVPSSLREAAFRRKDIVKFETVDTEKASECHNEYIMSLRKLGIDVIELQADDTLPESTFVDCIAVVCNGTALMGKPHMISRRKEVDIIRTILRKEGIHIVDIKDTIATLDASDVFFTGREFFVGLSKRTNIIGAKAVAAAFPEYPVSLIKLRKGGYHLKAYVSVAGPDLIAIGSSEAAKDILKQMKDIAEYKKYKIITINEMPAVNCIYANSTLLHCSHEELPISSKVFATRVEYPRIELKNREFFKVDRFLTCRSLLFTKKRIYSILAAAQMPSVSMLIPQTYDMPSQPQQINCINPSQPQVVVAKSAANRLSVRDNSGEVESKRASIKASKNETKPTTPTASTAVATTSDKLTSQPIETNNRASNSNKYVLEI